MTDRKLRLAVWRKIPVMVHYQGYKKLGWFLVPYNTTPQWLLDSATIRPYLKGCKFTEAILR